MASKRRLKVTKAEEPSLPLRMVEDSWTTWFKVTYAKRWYVLGCILLDIVVGLELLGHSEWGWNREVSLVTVMFLVSLEIVIYLKMWGKNGVWNDEREI